MLHHITEVKGHVTVQAVMLLLVNFASMLTVLAKTC